MNAPFRLPRRTRRVPKHAGMLPAPVAGPGPQERADRETGQVPAVRPLTAPAFTGVSLEFPPAQDEDPGMTEALAPLRAAPGATAPPQPPDLQRVLDGLRNLDAPSGASLRCITADGTSPHIPLRGFPSYAGITRLADGTPMAGLWLDDEDGDGRLVIDVTDPAWLRAWLRHLIDAAEDTMDALHEALNAAPDEETKEGDAA